MTQVDALAEDQVQADLALEPAPEAVDPAADASPEAEPRPPSTETVAPDPYERVAAKLDTLESGITRQLSDYQRQLSRLEGRFDKGQEPAAVKELRTELRKEIGELKGSLQNIGNQRAALEQLEALQQEASDTRRALDLVLKRTLDPEELTDYQRTQAEEKNARAQAKADRLRQEAEERAAKAEARLAEKLSPAEPAPEPKPAPRAEPAAESADDPEVIAATAELTDLIRAAEVSAYNPDDPAFVQRLVAKANALGVNGRQGPWARYAVMAKAFSQIQAEDRKAAKPAAAPAPATQAKAEEDAKRDKAAREAERRQDNRAAVEVDRRRSPGAATKHYTSLVELEADFAADKIDPATFRQWAAKGLPYR